MNQLSDDCTVFLFINLISFVSLFTLHALGSREPHRTHVSLTNTHTQKGKTYTNTHHSTLQLTFYGSGGLWRSTLFHPAVCWDEGYSPWHPSSQLDQLSVLTRWKLCCDNRGSRVSPKMWELILTPLAGSPGGPVGPSSPFNPSGPVSPWKKARYKKKKINLEILKRCCIQNLIWENIHHFKICYSHSEEYKEILESFTSFVYVHFLLLHSLHLRFGSVN